MPSADSSRDARLERLAEEFVERHRRGEHPALAEYAGRHPELAADIQELFPALVKIEHLKPATGDLTGDFIPENSPRDRPTPERLGDRQRLLEAFNHSARQMDETPCRALDDYHRQAFAMLTSPNLHGREG